VLPVLNIFLPPQANRVGVSSKSVNKAFRQMIPFLKHKQWQMLDFEIVFSSGIWGWWRSSFHTKLLKPTYCW